MSSCLTCGRIGSEETWGEANPWMQTESRPAPANFERLQWTGLSDGGIRHVYRCGECQAYFFLTIHSSSGLAGNSDYDDYTLTRREPRLAAEPASEEAVQLLTQHCCQSGDFAHLDRLLGNERARPIVLRTLAVLVAERHPPSVCLERPASPGPATAMSSGTDLDPLEPTLRGFLSGPPDLAQAAARALARHLLRRARHDELQSLLSSGGPIQEGAVQALQDARWDARNFGFSGSRANEAVRALMLLHVRTRAWHAAIALVEELSSRRAASETISDLARGVLAGEGPVDLSPLEPALVKASKPPTSAWMNEPYEAAAAALAALRSSRPRG